MNRWNELPYLLQEFELTSILDILIVTGLIYLTLSQVRGTRSMLILRGLALVAIAMLFIVALPGLPALKWLVSKASPALVVTIPIIFQREIQRLFAYIGQMMKFDQYFQSKEVTDELIDTLVESCRRLSARKHGALIVMERATGLQEYIDTGVPINAQATVPLLLSIFHKDAELHDGGIIIRNGNIAAASCIMPLSNSQIDENMGLRHRAALGTSEVSDALVIIVSEETGNIAFAHNGVLLPRQSQQQLPNLLRSFLQNQDKKS